MVETYVRAALSKAEVEKALVALGGNADEVAASLKRMGLKGVRAEPWECPIARWAKSLGLEMVSVANFLCWYDPEQGVGSARCVDLPRAVSLFMVGFDNGWYPELEG